MSPSSASSAHSPTGCPFWVLPIAMTTIQGGMALAGSRRSLDFVRALLSRHLSLLRLRLQCCPVRYPISLEKVALLQPKPLAR